MNDRDLDGLCAQIENFLKRHAPDPGASGTDQQRDRAFWQTRPYLTAAELAALAELAGEPVCAESLACRLGRNPVETKAFLDALTAIGVLERGEASYTATPATRLYLESIADR